MTSQTDIMMRLADAISTLWWCNMLHFLIELFLLAGLIIVYCK